MGELSIASIEEAFKKSFSLNSIQLKYRMSNGNVQGLYQDFHLDNALKDTADSGAKYLELQITGSGGAASSAPASTPKPAATPAAAAPAASVPKPVTTVAAAVPAPASSGSRPSVSSPSPTNQRLLDAYGGPDPNEKPAAAAAAPASGGARKCTGCGANVSGKFCPECGTAQGAETQAAAPTPAPSRISASIPAAQSQRHKSGCAACGGDIGLTSVEAMDTNWHKECFVCQGCRKSLLECGFKAVNDLPMFAECYTDQYGLKCAACKKPIASEYVQVA